MILLRKSKNFARPDYAGLSKNGKKFLREFRNDYAKKLLEKRKVLKGIGDKAVRNFKRDTYLKSAEISEDLARKVAEQL